MKNLKNGLVNDSYKEFKNKTLSDNYKTIGCELDDFKEISSFLKTDFFSSMEQFHESLFHRRFTNLNDYNLPFCEKPLSEEPVGFSVSENKSLSHCRKCKQSKPLGLGLIHKENDGYFQGCLDWTKNWDNQTKQRILMQHKVIEENEMDLLVLLDFYIQNHDCLSLQRILESVDSKKMPEIIHFFENKLSSTTFFLRDFIQNFFAKSYEIYFKDEEESPKKKLRRMAKIGYLFPSTRFISTYNKPDFNDFLIHSLKEDVAGKYRLTPELHLQLMQFLVDQGYLLILDEYIRFYGIGLEPSFFDTIKKSPASFLIFLSRDPTDKLFELGMINAAWLTGANCLNEILQEKKIFRVMGILMYANIESFEIAYESKGQPYYIQKDLFVENIKEFPDLKAVVLERNMMKKKCK